MPASVDLRITDEIKTRLDRIAAANGFDVTRSQVSELNRLGTNATRLPRTYEVRIVSIAPNEAFDLPGNPPAVGKTLEVLVLAHESHSDSDTLGKDRDAVAMINAAIQAITNPPVNPHLWYTFAGLAIDAEMGEMARIKAGDGTPTGWGIPVLVHFRHDENDPTNPRA